MVDFAAVPAPEPYVVVGTPATNPNPQNAPEPIILIGGLPAATTSATGSVKQAAAQVNSVAPDVATLVTDFNALLAKLRTAGILAP